MPPSDLDLLFVGQAVWDQVFHVPRLDAAGGKNIATDHAARIGGLAAQAACAAQHLRSPAFGLHVRLVSAVGDDAAGDQLQQALRTRGLDVERVAGARTSVSAVLVDATGERQVHNFRGDALVRAPVPTMAPACAGVLADPRWPDAAQAALAHAHALGVPSMLDAEVASRDTLRALVPLAGWCVFSRGGLMAWAGVHAHDSKADTDADACTDATDVPAAMLSAVALEAPRAELLVTLGANGALWRRPDGTLHHLPAPAVKAVDTNGAGDVMHGVLLLSLAEGLPPEAAVRRAMAAAALACLGNLPSRKQLDNFVEHPT